MLNDNEHNINKINNEISIKFDNIHALTQIKKLVEFIHTQTENVATIDNISDILDFEPMYTQTTINDNLNAFNIKYLPNRQIYYTIKQ